MAEYREGRIFIDDYECRPRRDVPGAIVDFFFKFQELDWEAKEAVLRHVEYEEVLDKPHIDTDAMTTAEYNRHLDRTLLIAMLDNERTIKVLHDMEDAMRRLPEAE
jgi:hypothetical protein